MIIMIFILLELIEHLVFMGLRYNRVHLALVKNNLTFLSSRLLISKKLHYIFKLIEALFSAVSFLVQREDSS